jgi:ribonucleoside-diphosphate reductase alpha chain
MQLYDLAYDLGCKGVTYYREGSRDAVLSSASEPKKAATPAVPDDSAPALAPVDGAPVASAVSPSVAPIFGAGAIAAPAPAAPPATVKPRPQTVFGYTRRVKAPEGTANITINSDQEGPLEVFINVGRAGSDIAALAEAMGRLISLSLRLPSPIPPEERLQLMATQLRGIGGSRSIGFGAERVLSLPDAVAQALTWHLQQGLSDVPAPFSGTPNRNGDEPTPMQLTLPVPAPMGNICPQCGSSSAYVMEEGCKKCHSCGYSEC